MKPCCEDHTHTDDRVIDARGREIQRSWLRSKWLDFADRLVDSERRQRGMRRNVITSTTSRGTTITLPDAGFFPIGTEIRIQY